MDTHIFLFPAKNFAVVALMAIKNELKDPYNVLENWDINSVDPCSWRMITCTPDGFVSALYVSTFNFITFYFHYAFYLNNFWFAILLGFLILPQVHMSDSWLSELKWTFDMLHFRRDVCKSLRKWETI